MTRTEFAWLWGDDTLSDATLNLCVADKSVFSASLSVHRTLLAAHSEYFKARLLRWAGSGSQGSTSFQPSTIVAHFAKTGSLPAGLSGSQLAQACKEAKVQGDLLCAEACSQALVDQAVEQHETSQLPVPCFEEIFDSQAECDAARLVVRGMYEGVLAEEVKDPLTVARICRVAERWAFPSLSSSCLQKLVALPLSQLPAEQLMLVLQTLPDSCALLPEHKKWQKRVHSLAGDLNALPLLLHLYGDVHAVITSAKLRRYFQQLPFAAVQQWAGSDELTVDSENSVVELISLWMAGPVKMCWSKEQKQQLSCLVRVQHLSPAYALGRLPTLAWFDIPETPTVVVAQAAVCECLELVLHQALPAWCAAPRKPLDPDELLRRSTIRWDVPRQQLLDLLASEDPTAKIYSEPVYSAGAGWRVYLNSVGEFNDEDDVVGILVGCWGQLVTYAECKGHALGAKLPHGSHVKDNISRGTSLGHDWSASFGWTALGDPSFLGKSLATAADLEPFLKDGCLQITAAFQVMHRPGCNNGCSRLPRSS
ncbi:hypothetical protein V8C86DRAFT_857258 [Haematococcus lacustris]